MKTLVNRALRFVLVVVVGLSILGCQKGYEMTLPLAVSRGEYKLKSAYGSSYFTVYSTSTWNITYGNAAEWLRLSKTSGKGETQVNFEYDENNSMSRGVTLIITSGDLTCEVYIGQAGGSLEPNYTLPRQSYSFLAEPIALKVAATTNLQPETISLAYADVYYTQEENIDWISGVEITSEGVSFKVAENLSGEKRDAQVEITFPSAKWDTPAKTIFTVAQDSENATLGTIVDTYTVDPNGINPINIDLGVNFDPEFYDYKVVYTIKDAEGNDVNWLRNISLNETATRFVAYARANRIADRAATLTFNLVDETNAVMESHSVALSQVKSDAESQGNVGSGTGEEPKDNEQDF